MRTDEEVLARIDSLVREDMFGFHREVLIMALSYEVAIGFYTDGIKTVEGKNVTAEEWEAKHRFKGEYLIDQAQWYFDFAIGKALDHRGLSASRSIDKLTEYAWLMKNDKAMQALEDAEYMPYGVPKLRAFCHALEWESLWLDAAEKYSDFATLERMARGEKCQEDCESYHS